VEPILSEDSVSFHVPNGETFLPDFVLHFPQHLSSIGLRRPTLEDVFLAMTGHEIRDEVLDQKDMMLKGMSRWQ
jgi:ABC-2 type transport system ATP-binding protein